MLGMLLVGIGAALAASVLFNVGIVLQALDARVVPKALGLRVSLLWRLVHRPRWVLGAVLGLVGIAPQVLAYSDAPFIVIQPALITGMLLLVIFGEKILDERVGKPELIGMLAIIGGIALLAWGAPNHAETHRSAPAVLSVVGGLCLLGLLPFALRGTRLNSGLLLAVASGSGFGATNIATKLVGDDYSTHLVRAWIWVAVVVVMGVVATLVGMTAFQRLAATTVVPVSTCVQTFLPIVLEPLFLRERWASANLDGAPIVVGLVVALVGCVLVSRSPAVSELIAQASDGT